MLTQSQLILKGARLDGAGRGSYLIPRRRLFMRSLCPSCTPILQLHIRKRVEIPARGIAGKILIVALAAYHRGIVSAESKRRDEQLAARFPGSSPEVCADA